MRQKRVMLDRVGQGEELLPLDLAEVEALEKLGQQHHLRALGGGLAHHLGGLGHVLLAVGGHGHLNNG